MLVNLKGGRFVADTDVEVFVSYRVGGSMRLPAERVAVSAAETPAMVRQMTVERLRSELLALLQFTSCEENSSRIGEAKLREEVARLRKLGDAGAVRALEAFFKDMQGEVPLALDRKTLRRWGYHFLRSLLAAHRLRLCNNFKDPGVQEYATPLLRHYQYIANDVFNRLPPPAGTGSGIRIQEMSALNSTDNPCMHGDTLVHMADGSLKKAKDVQQGDQVLTGLPARSATAASPSNSSSESAMVLCVVKTLCSGGQASLVTLPRSGLRVTPYHPVFVGGRWQFPVDLAAATVQACEAVYSFVLAGSRHSSVLINDVPCISLGHGITDDPVAAHPYFAQAALQDLYHMPGWEQGCITFKPGCLLRQPSPADGVHPGLVCGFDSTKAVPAAAISPMTSYVDSVFC